MLPELKQPLEDDNNKLLEAAEEAKRRQRALEVAAYMIEPFIPYTQGSWRPSTYKKAGLFIPCARNRRGKVVWRWPDRAT